MGQMCDIIDFHAHILPGADHGSSGVDISLSQLKLASWNGVSRIVATPHFYPDRHSVESFVARREASHRALEEKTAERSDLPRVAIGAEVLICDGIERLPLLSELCIEGTDILLLELPFSVFELQFRDSVLRLIKQGYRIVLAHADRYDPKDIELLLDAGAKIQLNATALSGFRVTPHIKKWLLQGDVVALGSDIHGLDAKAYKRFLKAQKRMQKLGVLEYVKNASDSMNIAF